MALKDIPAELRERKIWMLWLSENGTKIPYRTGGGRGSSTDPQAWTSFEMACKQEHLYTGIALAINYPYTGIDLDGCLDADGQLADWAAEIVEAFRGLAYCEISPSGTGLKLITRARKPDGARCVAKMGEGKCQVEIYDQGRFWAMTGNVWQGLAEIGDGSEALRGLCERLWPAAEAKPVQMVRIGSVSDLADRARQYVERVPGEVRGNLRNAAFKLAGNLHAFVGDSGERLSDADVEELLTSWNQRNSPPLRQDELAEATVNGRKNGTLPADKVPGMMRIEQDSEVDISGILAGGRSEPEPEREKLFDPGDFPEELRNIEGLIGDLVGFNLRTAQYPLPELALGGALALMSTLTAGKVETSQQGRSNLYILGLAPSGAGKDHSRKLNRRILAEIGLANRIGPEAIGSHAGIVSQMDAEWCTLFQIDEIAHLIHAMQHRSAPHLAQIAARLMTIYSSAGDPHVPMDAYGDRAKVKTLHYPHAVIYGTSVPEGFWEAVTEDNMKNGLIGRFLVFEAMNYVDYQDPEPSRGIPDSIIQAAKSWAELRTHGGNLDSGGAHPKLLNYTPDAYQRHKEHSVNISKRRQKEDPVPAAIWSRVAEKTAKLTMLIACSRFDGGEWPEMTLEDVELAIRLNNWITRRMLWQADRHISQSDFHRDCQYVLRKLQEKKNSWFSLSELTRKTRKLSPRDRQEVLKHLLTEKSIDAEEIPPATAGGRPTQRFRSVD
jgi:hypothetical protein